MLVAAALVADLDRDGEFAGAAGRFGGVESGAVEVADLVWLPVFDDGPCSADELAGHRAARRDVVVVPVDHEPAVVVGELRVVAACDVGGLVVDEPQRAGPSLVMRLDRAAVSPDSQRDGSSPTNATACFAVGNWPGPVNQPRDTAATMSPIPGIEHNRSVLPCMTARSRTACAVAARWFRSAIWMSSSISPISHANASMSRRPSQNRFHPAAASRIFSARRCGFGLFECAATISAIDATLAWASARRFGQRSRTGWASV